MFWDCMGMQHTFYNRYLVSLKGRKKEEEKTNTSNKHFKVTIKYKRFVQHLLTFKDVTLKPCSIITHVRRRPKCIATQIYPKINSVFEWVNL